MKRIIFCICLICLLGSVSGQVRERVTIVTVEKTKKEKPKKEPKQHTYEEHKFVVGGLGLGGMYPYTALRVQAGMAKRFGFYVAGLSNFDERWALHVGTVFRVIPNFTTYAGMGYGQCRMNILFTGGFEIDFGLMYSFDRFVVSGGLDSGGLNIGLGFKF